MKVRTLLLPLASAIGRWRERRWRGVRFLCYHSVCQPDELPGLARRTSVISVDGFRRHLELMRETGYHVVSMERALALVASGDAEQGQYVCLTFDDGREDNFLNAWPLLRQAGCSAHFFVSSGLLGKTVREDVDGVEHVERYMNADMLRTIIGEGGSIGSHAHRHVDLTTLDRITLRRELQESRRLLEEATRGAIHTHAYPWAVYDRDVLAAAREAGYRYAFASAAGGTVKALDGDHASLTIGRNSIRSGLDPDENYVTLRGGMDFSQPYSVLKTRLRYRV